MRHLKYFENSSKIELNQFNIIPEEIRECFYDIEDEGDWSIIVKFVKKLTNSSIDKSIGTISMSLIPVIELKIYKKPPLKISAVEMQEFKKSEIYKNCINLLNGRLLDNNLFIKTDVIENISNGGSQIFILIYRKSDEN